MKRLCSACQSGSLLRVKKVMTEHPSLITKETTLAGWRILHDAVSAKRFKIVKYLIPVFAELEDARKYAARLACGLGKTEIAKLLVSSGVDIFNRDGLEVVWAAERGHVDSVDCLIGLGADMAIYADKAYDWAKSNGKSEVVKYITNLILKEEKKYTLLILLNKNRAICGDLIDTLTRSFVRYDKVYQKPRK